MFVRNMDAQGNLLTRKIDANGNLIGDQTTNINSLFSSGQDKLGTSISDQIANLSESQQGFMASTQQAFGDNTNRLQQLMGNIQTGFDSTDQTMSRQIKDMAGITSGMTDLDMGMRQNFKQMGDAFDDNGKLIQSSIDENGNTVTRAIDKSGNLLLRQFDVTGRAMGDKVVNINKALNDLSTVKNLPGANVSMGNLSPAMQGNVPTGGFMSPYSQTRA
jgi:hypothetical protein